MSRLVGFNGEWAALEYLKKLNYCPIERNYHSRFGEIDLIVENDDYLVFAEVKTRKKGSLVSGIDSVDYHKIEKLRATADIYLSSHQTKKQPRFDVIEVETASDGYYITKHIENAF